jgi:hypothetical protein
MVEFQNPNLLTFAEGQTHMDVEVNARDVSIALPTGKGVPTSVFRDAIV